MLVASVTAPVVALMLNPAGVAKYVPPVVPDCVTVAVPAFEQ